MSKSKIFVGMVIGLAVGILMESSWGFPSVFIFLEIAISVMGFAFGYISQKKILIGASIFFCCVGLGAFRQELSIVPNQYQDLLDSKQHLEGYIVEEPNLKTAQQTLTFQPKGYSQNILVTTSLVQEFAYGDWATVEGKVSQAKNYGDFDYQKYLERYNIYATISYPKILILKSHQLNWFKEKLLEIKSAFIRRLAEIYKEPELSLAIGILIGGHAGLPQTIVDDFSKTGVSHIIAVSGFNISIIIFAVASLAYIFGRKLTFWLGLITIICFVIITGASASVLRAAVMGFLLLLSTYIGRQYSVVPALFAAGGIMLLINPKILFWDVGFQLSFAATLGIVYFFPLLAKLTNSLPEVLGLKILILTTLSAIIATLPIILYNFGTLSLIAPLVNVFILPTVPYAMLFGFLSCLPFIGPGFGLVANWLLAYILRAVQIGAALPYSSFNFVIPTWVFWLLILSVFGIYFGIKTAVSLFEQAKRLC